MAFVHLERSICPLLSTLTQLTTHDCILFRAAAQDSLELARLKMLRTFSKKITKGFRIEMEAGRAANSAECAERCF